MACAGLLAVSQVNGANVIELRILGPRGRFTDQPLVPKDAWLEGLVKAYVGDGIASDFYREISAFVDPSIRDLVTQVLSDSGHAEFVVTTVRAAITSNPKVAGRLALWGRRLVGEALSQAQRVAADRDGLASLVVGSADGTGADLAELVRMFGRLTSSHTRRMAMLGLSA